MPPDDSPAPTPIAGEHFRGYTYVAPNPWLSSGWLDKCCNDPIVSYIILYETSKWVNNHLGTSWLFRGELYKSGYTRGKLFWGDKKEWMKQR